MFNNNEHDVFQLSPETDDYKYGPESSVVFEGKVEGSDEKSSDFLMYTAS